MTTTPLLSGTGLGIMRGERVLFSELSVSLAAGEALLVRGDNGTGKTTLLRVLAGLTISETGTRDSAPCHWVGHRSGMKPHETPCTHLSTWARSWGATSTQIDTSLDRLALTRAADVPASALSAGQRKRTSLARTQLVDRPLWLLDEPFSALDAEGRAQVATLIDHHREAGGGIIAAVHGDVPVMNAKELTL